MKKPNLIIICGPTASGKTTVSKLVQTMSDQRLAYIDHDYLREVVFSTKKDDSRSLRLNMIKHNISLAIDSGWDVIYDTTLDNSRLYDLIKEIKEASNFKLYKFYLNSSIEESKRRHLSRPQANEFGVEYIEKWFPDFESLKSESIELSEQASPEEKAASIIKVVYGEDIKED